MMHFPDFLERIADEPATLTGDDMALAIRCEVAARGSFLLLSTVHEGCMVGCTVYQLRAGTWHRVDGSPQFVADGGEAFRAASRGDQNALRVFRVSA